MCLEVGLLDLIGQVVVLLLLLRSESVPPFAQDLAHGSVRDEDVDLGLDFINKLLRSNS